MKVIEDELEAYWEYLFHLLIWLSQSIKTLTRITRMGE
jgi:hypothetical protein